MGVNNSTRTNRAVVLLGCLFIAVVILFITQRSYESEANDNHSTKQQQHTTTTTNLNNDNNNNNNNNQEGQFNTGQTNKNQFPPHWGEPPRLQTRDIRELPGGYGFGSGTLAKWIKQHMEKDELEGRRREGGVEIPEDLVEQPEYLP